MNSVRSSSVDDYRWQRRLRPIGVGRVFGFFLAALLWGNIHAVHADGMRVSATLHPCADDSGGVGSCTANEIDIADATEILIAGSPTSCTGGETLQVATINARYGLNTGVRYDPLLWIGQRGNDPRDPDPYIDPEDETVGSCFVTSAPESEDYPDLFDHLEGDDNDSCLDIANPDLDYVDLPYQTLNFEIECQDADSDGEADVHVLVTWVQNTHLLCGNGPGEVFGTGAPPKCNYSLVQLGIQYLPPPEATLTVAKTIESDDGGAATLDDFNVSVDGAEVDWDNPSSTTGGSELAATGAGTYTLSEANVDGYTEGTWSCVDDDEQGVPVTNGGLFSGADVTVAEGQQVTCSITNIDDAPTLTLIKSVINDDGGGAGPGDFTLRLDGGNYVNAPFGSGDSPAVEANTAYTLSEDPLAGYADMGVSCFDEGAEMIVPHPVTLALGQVVTCTLTNDDIPPGAPVLTLLKSVTNDNGGDADPADFQLRLDGGIYDGAPFTSGAMPPVEAGTPYTLSEDAYPGYANLGVTCFDETAEMVVPHPVTLAAEQVVTCTLANDDIAPELTVIKHVVNDDGGDAVAGDWTMVVTATNPSDNDFPGAEAPGTTITIDAGPYSVSEADGPDGYETTFDAGCSGSLDVGETATCIATGDDIQPSLTITKTILFNDEGSATLGDFNVSVDAVEVDWPDPSSTTGGTQLVATLADSYTLSESELDGYDEGTWSCSDQEGEVPVTNGGLFSGADVTVAVGREVSCGIINVFEGGPIPEQSLTVAKVIVSDDEGAATLADFNVAVDGVEVAWSNPASITGGIELVTEDAGTYTLSEDELGTYEEGAWTCSDLEGSVPVSNGGAFDGADVTVGPGQQVTCSITNDDEPIGPPPPPVEQSLTVEKIIISDNGGAATVEDFDVSVDGVEVHWWHPDSPTGDTEVVTDLPGTYRLSEADLDGYVEGRWTCSDEYGEVPVSNEGHFSGADVTVEPGQHLHCSITNNDYFVPEPGLVVQKIIRSDHGGNATLDDFDVSVNGFEVAWDDPGSTDGGIRFVSGKPGVYTLSESETEGYIEGQWSCRDAEYAVVPVTNDGLFSGADVMVEPGDQVTCTITNADEKPPADLRVTKTITPPIGECGVLLGQQIEFAVEVSNAGPGTAEGVILQDHWSWQLKPISGPDMYECKKVEEKERWLLCKLGNLEPGESRDLGFSFMVGGRDGENACNTATVSSNTADGGNPDDNESPECVPLVKQLSLAPECGDLEPAMVGMHYEQFIDIVGGSSPYTVEEVEGLPDDLSFDLAGNAIRIVGCPTVEGDSEFKVILSDRLGCQDTRADPPSCHLHVAPYENPDCGVGPLRPLETIRPAGSPTPDPDVLPDESVQKIVVDDQSNRYLVGYAYRQHDYASDPNGPYAHHAGNYDIRVVKYDNMGALEWDKTYDTGNDDYGFAIVLDTSTERPGLFVGGGAEVESGDHAWHEALLMSIDPETGCPIDRHFQSAGMGTTSAYYDIATDGVKLYAVGERQANEKLAGEYGALIGIYDNNELATSPVACDGDHHIIGYPPDGNDPALEEMLVRTGASYPIVAYSVKLPEPECTECSVLVGGRSGQDGWLDAFTVDGDRSVLTPFPAPPDAFADISVQDLAVPGDNRVIVVGSSSANEMRVLAFDRDGNAAWAPKNLGDGRLRGVTVDDYGAVYVAGHNDDEASAGLLFKFDASGRQLSSLELQGGFSTSFTDVAILAPGSGVIAARTEASAMDYGWQQVEFDCDDTAGSCPPARE